MPPISKRGFSPQRSQQQTRPTPINTGGLRTIDESGERALLKSSGGKGHLVDVYEGSANRGTTVTVHGINGSPEDMRALAMAAKKKGQDVKTFVYDDQKTRLDKTSQELAGELTKLSKETRGPLTIQAHSMGGRLTADALRKMQESGVLGKNVKVEMINPVIGGLESANSARLAPGVVSGLIPGVNPGKDMGTDSIFQERLETIKMPSKVDTTIFVGDKDHLVDPQSPSFKAVANGMNAKLVNVPGAGHDDALQRVASR